MSAGSAFVDSNILLYAFLSKEPVKARKATALLDELSRTRSGVMSYQVLQEFVNVMRKGARPPMDVDRCEHIVSEMAGRFEMVSPSLTLLQRALQLHSRYQISWYDALIVAAAQAGRCAVLYSEDLSSGQDYGDVRVINPFV